MIANAHVRRRNAIISHHSCRVHRAAPAHGLALHAIVENGVGERTMPNRRQRQLLSQGQLTQGSSSSVPVIVEALFRRSPERLDSCACHVTYRGVRAVCARGRVHERHSLAGIACSAASPAIGPATQRDQVVDADPSHEVLVCLREGVRAGLGGVRILSLDAPRRVRAPPTAIARP